MTARAPYPPLTGREPCRAPTADPEDWFALETDPDTPDEDTPDPAAVARAVAACHTCPIRTACLAYALDHPLETEAGIWAATTPAQRRTLRREFAI